MAAAAEVLDGLAQPQKRLPSKLFYDAAGSRLFDEICRQPEYYVTRTELAILRDRLREIAAFLGPRCALIEPGAGNGFKALLLLAALREPAAYVPVDVCAEHLRQCAERIRTARPGLAVLPVCADFTGAWPLPRGLGRSSRTIYFPGSTIGNFEPAQAVRLLAAFRLLGDALLIGVDACQDPARLAPAYDDAAGVTARFNLNLLVRLNREFGGTFDPGNFQHRAFYDAQRGRVEMHLVSRRPQTVRVGGRLFALRSGETLHTENSYKYRPAEFAALAARAGWRPQHCWTDAAGRFGLHACSA